MPSKKAHCGLCGKTKNLMKTSCCGNWICNDHDKYIIFSFARNSCARNHDRFTLCGFHHREEHEGHWKECDTCRKSFGTEMYVWSATNEYNFEVLENPPHYEPTRCDQCGKVIKLGTEAHSIGPRGTLCSSCTDLDLSASPARPKKKVRPVRGSREQLSPNPNPFAIDIILAQKAQKRWNIRPTVRAREPAAHWLSQWRLDFASRPDRTQVVLVTNVATLYTFVFNLKELGRGAHLEKLFRFRLGTALREAPSLSSWLEAPIVFAAGNPRTVVGAMNDMRKHIAWAPLGFDREEEMINSTPYLFLEESFPDRAFAQKLAVSLPQTVPQNP